MPPSRADRKLEKKLAFYSMVGDRVAALNAQKNITKKKRPRRRQKNLKAYDLSSLSEVLPEFDDLNQKPVQADAKLTCKSRLKIILKESEMLRMVLNNQTFRSDPLAAINLHLQATQPVMDEKPKTSKSDSKKKKEKKKKKKKKKKGNSSGGPQVMEM